MRWFYDELVWMFICVLLLICVAAAPFVRADEPVLEWEVAVIADTKDFQFSEIGDIIDFKPAGWDWGKEERRLFAFYRIKGTRSQMQALVEPMTVVVGEQDGFDFDGNPIKEPVVEVVKSRRYGLSISTVDANNAVMLNTNGGALEAAGIVDKELKE